MKKQILFIAMIMISKIIIAQDITIATIAYSDLNPATKPDLSVKARTLTDPERDKFKDPTVDKIQLNFTGSIPANTKVYLNEDPNPIAIGNIDITPTMKAAITSFQDNRIFKFKVVNPANPAPGVVAGSFTIKWSKLSSSSNKDAELQSQKNRKKIITAFKTNASFTNPYDDKNNRVDLYFNENGKLLNQLPVNIDQNDIFYMHVLCVKGDEEKYSVNVIEGEYAPSDLSIRPTEKLNATITGESTDNENNETPKEYTSVTIQSGPYTSDNFKFQISYDSSGTIKNGTAYSLKINKLYHVGIGISFISTNLENPDFHVFFNGTDTTIKAFNTGNRTLFTINAIWYWSVLQQNKKGSTITGGRDVLKDEPTFSIKRLFPTFGVTLDNTFKQNFFLGGVYEFARGGSIIAGLHYGQVTELADKNFVLEKTKFSGTDANIQLDHVYKSGFFIGINVDTRIINAIFNAKSSN